MSQEEQQQQNELIQKSLQNNAKDQEALKKLGEEMSEKAKQDVKQMTNDIPPSNQTQNSSSVNSNQTQGNSSVNSSQTQHSNSVNTTSLTSTPSTVNTANAGVRTLNSTLIFAITVIIPFVFLRLSNKNKEKSKQKKFSSYKKVIMVFCTAAYFGQLINIFVPGLLTGYIICVFVLIVGFKFLKVRGKIGKKENTEIVKEVGSGVVIGAVDSNLITKPEKKPGNLLCVGAPGKGKSQAITIPSLLNWNGSAVVVDIKRELYAYTHKVQEKKGKVIVFDPEQNGHAYDPIRECNTVDGCQFLSRALVPMPKDINDPFWITNAQNILAAACYEGHKEGKNLPEIAERILTTKAETLVSELVNSKYKEAQLLASSCNDTSEKTLSGIFTQLRGELIIYATDNNIKQALSKSEWSAETLEEGATIYLRVSERQIETYRKVWNLIIVQILRHLSSRAEHKDPAILLLLDELPRLGKVEGYSAALGTLRSKEVVIVSAVQSLAQLQEHYGKEVTRIIMDTHEYKICLSASDNETQKVFSDLAGKVEKQKESRSFQPGQFFGGSSFYKQWEEKFRPEMFAYLEKPIYYQPHEPAFEVDKVFWMDIPHLVKLQKQCGGPTGFLSDGDIQELSIFKRDIKDSTNDLDKINSESRQYEEKEKVIEYLEKLTITSTSDEEVDDYLNITDQEEIGHIELLEQWKIK